MNETDKIRTGMNKLDKKVRRLNQMISKFDRDMRTIKSKESEGQVSSWQNKANVSENSSSYSYNDPHYYEFKFADDRGGELQRKSDIKSQRSSKPRDDFFSFLVPDPRMSVFSRKDHRRDDVSKSATKDRVKE
jgi:hypothetical protein